MAAANNLLPKAFTGRCFPYITADRDGVKVSVSSSVYASTSGSFWGTTAILYAGLSATNIVRTIHENTTHSGNHTIEIFNITSANGGVLTNILTQELNAAGEITVTIECDDKPPIVITTYLDRPRRLLMGYFSAGVFTQVDATILSAHRAFADGVGIEFDNTLKVSITGDLNINTSSQANKSYCSAYLRKFVEV